MRGAACRLSVRLAVSRGRAARFFSRRMGGCCHLPCQGRRVADEAGGGHAGRHAAVRSHRGRAGPPSRCRLRRPGPLRAGRPPALLRDAISALGEDLLVVAEEFGHWEDARRRVDLLALDRAGHLVVIELKRDETGGHMELQAIRYAAMVSSMGFAEVAAAYAAHCARYRPGEEVDARAELAAFLDAGDGDEEPVISTDVRILVVSGDFGREITTTVLWLNGFDGMDIRCVRIAPYDLDGRVLLDVQQVLPLPEAADYQVRLRRKDAARERARTDGRDFTRYHVVIEGVALPHENKRNAIRTMVEQLAARGVALAQIRATLPERAMRRADLATATPSERRCWRPTAGPTPAASSATGHSSTRRRAGPTWCRRCGGGTPSRHWRRWWRPEAKVTFRRADSPED